jgi:hypothetical protein
MAGGTSGWDKKRDRDFEISPTGREFKYRIKLDVGECRFTGHDHESGSHQYVTRMSSGSAHWTYPMPHPSWAWGRPWRPARRDAKARAAAAGHPVPGLG